MPKGATGLEEQPDAEAAAEGFAIIKPDSKGAIALMEAMNSAHGK